MFDTLSNILIGLTLIAQHYIGQLNIKRYLIYIRKNLFFFNSACNYRFKIMGKP